MGNYQTELQIVQSRSQDYQQQLVQLKTDLAAAQSELEIVQAKVVTEKDQPSFELYEKQLAGLRAELNTVRGELSSAHDELQRRWGAAVRALGTFLICFLLIVEGVVPIVRAYLLCSPPGV